MGAAGHSALPPKVAERLRRLAENGTADQWCVDRDIDWSRRERLPLWISRRHAAIAISQLYHGEMATVRLCRRLLGQVEEPLLRRCLTLQIGDEARHAEAYRRYLERLGGVMPVEPALARALDLAGRGTLGTAGTVMAYHIVAEGEVLRLQERLAGFFPCPLLRQVSRRSTDSRETRASRKRRPKATCLASSRATRRETWRNRGQGKKPARRSWSRSTSPSATMWKAITVPGVPSVPRPARSRARASAGSIGMTPPSRSR